MQEPELCSIQQQQGQRHVGKEGRVLMATTSTPPPPHRLNSPHRLSPPVALLAGCTARRYAPDPVAAQLPPDVR
jgi:hypothetical protein